MDYEEIRRGRREAQREPSFLQKLAKIVTILIATIIIGIIARIAFFEITVKLIQHQAEQAQKAITIIGEDMKRKQQELKAQAPPRIVGYRENRVLGRSWEECIKEYGRGRNELNAVVARCKEGYIESIPIYNK